VRVLIGLASCLFATPVLADTHDAALLAALNKQDAWLAGSPKGAAWQKFLIPQTLREELAKGKDADLRAVAKVVGRYESGVPGLNHAGFQQTRQRLNEWADELGVPMALRWAESARGVALDFVPIDGKDVLAAKTELIEAMEELDRQFGKTNPDNADAWKTFLKWDDTEQQIQAEPADWTRLEGAWQQYYNGHPGLELPEFVRVRNALRKYIFLGKLSDQPAAVTHTTMVDQIEALASALEQYNQTPSVKASGNIATLIDWLDQLGRLPKLAAELRAHHRHPNLLVQVSEDFISRRFSETVDETRPVNEMILGTHVRGTAHTTGTISANVIPSKEV
ncbi:MAG: hypothetical protein ACE1ZA_00485, partial [Pseudomonadales bacterium]